jgi:multimeric flavodoxin WrbA
MNIIAFNASPRKDWNTATLLNKALEGAASRGAKTELIHLFEFRYRGCSSCFSCKKIGGSHYGTCAKKDDLTPLLEKVRNSDGFILGSPNYIGMPSASAKAFLERLVAPYIVYAKEMSSLFGRTIPAGFIYTMNSSEEWMKKVNYEWVPVYVENVFKLIFGSGESLVANDTFQFDDYSKYASSRWDPAQKAERRRTQFPIDCQKAFEMGVRFAGGVTA